MSIEFEQRSESLGKIGNRIPVTYWQFRWHADRVPSEEEHLLLKTASPAMFRHFQKEKKKELRAELNRVNPFRWSVVLYLVLACLVFLVLGKGLAMRWADIGFVIVFFLTLIAFLSVGWSRCYIQPLHSQRVFYHHCREAAKLYDYTTFARFVETKLLKHGPS